MNEYKTMIEHWSEAGKPIALARVIKTWGSSPRPVGSELLINYEGKMVGSVSGGCVEGAVVKASRLLVENGGAQTLAFGVADEDAWSVGLSCGGKVQVFLEAVDFTKPPWATLLDNLENNTPSILVSSLEEGKHTTSLINEKQEVIGDALSDKLLAEAQQAYNERIHKTVEYQGKSYFMQVFPRKSLLLVIGAAHITADLVALGNQFNFETVVIDPRGYFSQNVVFNDAPSKIIEAYPSEVLNDYPLDAYTYCAVLSHDPKIDDNALEVLLPSEVAYIGALGSRKTHAKRTNRLLEKGIRQALIDRIAAPIGLSIKAKTPKEIALAIMGQILEVKNQYA